MILPSSGMSASGTEATSSAPDGGENDRQPVAWPVAAGVLLVGVVVVLAALVLVRRSDQPATTPERDRRADAAAGRRTDDRPARASGGTSSTIRLHAGTDLIRRGHATPAARR
ncbi:MAG TPA: hypothetical protein VGL99_08610 [Chloroflexota bacterium]|jgi:hypothetical protein